MLYIVTGNKGKFEAAQKFLADYGVQCEQKILDIVEPQGENIEEIARYKASQAFHILDKPVVVMDSGWEISALNGFPGAYMHSIVKWFTIEDFQALMASKSDRKITLHNVAVYKDAAHEESFHRNLEGRILDEPRGEGNFVDRLVTYRKDGKTIAECEKAGFPIIDEGADISQWIKLGEWLKDKT